MSKTLTKTRLIIATLTCVTLLLAGGALIEATTHRLGRGAQPSSPATSSGPVSLLGAKAPAPVTVTAKDAGGPADYAKDQNVYGILGPDGQARQVYVVNQFSVSRPGKLTDYGTYQQVQNLSSTRPIGSQGGQQTTRVGKGIFYYQGELPASRAQLPWKIAITYSLDGKTVDAKHLAGASGRAQLRIEVTKNPSAKPDIASYFDAYVLQITFTVPTSSVRDIDAGTTGIVADAGANKQVTFMLMPGKAGSFSFAATAKHFSMSAISLAAAPFSLDVDSLVDTKALTSGMSRLSQGMQGLADGSASLDSGSRTLADGLDRFDGGLAQTAAGATSLNGAAASLARGVQDYTSGVTQLADGSQKLTAGVTQLADGLTTATQGSQQFSTGLKTQADQLAQQASPQALNQAGQAYQTALKDYSTALGTLAATNITKLLAFMQVTNSLPDPVADPGSYRSALLAAIASQPDADVKSMLTKVLNLFDTQTALSKLAGVAGAAQALAGAAQGADQLTTGLTALDQGAAAGKAGAQSLTAGLAKAATGGQTLAAGANKYAAGLTGFTAGLKSLQAGADALTAGSDGLVSGAGQLSAGMKTMAASTAAIPAALQEQIAQATKAFSGKVTPVDFVDERNNNDLAQVQFMLTTKPIEAAATVKPVAQPRVPSFWERLRNLFVDVKEE